MPLETVSEPSLPGARHASGKYQRAEVTVSWSLENMGYNLPTLVSTVQDNHPGFELSLGGGSKRGDQDARALPMAARNSTSENGLARQTLRLSRRNLSALSMMTSPVTKIMRSDNAGLEARTRS